MKRSSNETEKAERLERLREMVAAYKATGSTISVAKLLGVRPTTIVKISRGRNISNSVTEKMERRLAELGSPPTVVNSENDEIDPYRERANGIDPYQERAKQLLAKYRGIEAAAASIGLRPATFRKILNGSEVASATLFKLNGQEHSPEQGRAFVRLTGIFSLYQQHGTLEAVGKLIGLTRERVRQLLVKGSKLGIFRYQPRSVPVEFPKTDILSAFEETGSRKRAASKLGIPSPSLAKLLKVKGISTDEVEDAVLSYRKRKAIADFKQLSEKLGTISTTTPLEQDTTGRSLYMRITRYWGSIDNFRAELNLPKPPQGNPRFKEISRETLARRSRIAFIVRMQHFEMIMESLQQGPLSLSEIAQRCSFKNTRTYRLVRILISRGEIVREGVGPGCRYRRSI